MSKGPDNDKSSNSEKPDQAREQKRVDKTMLDINLGDLIDPLSETLTGTEKEKTPAESPTKSKTGKVAKTMLDSALPSFSEINETEKLNSADLVDQKVLQDPESEPEPKKINRLAKTQIELSIPAAESLTEDARDDESPLEQQTSKAISKQNLKRLRSKKISNTMLELEMPSSDLLEGNDLRRVEHPDNLSVIVPNAVPESAAEPILPSTSEQTAAKEDKEKNVRRREQYVPKTMLDHNMLFTALSNSALREEAKVAALAEERANLPPKPKLVPVKADKPSSDCPFKWEDPESKEKYRYCTNCQTPIYNFEGMERPEAEALIFTRENRKKFTLYSRSDGKFMTVDCPLQEKRKKELVLAIVGGTALVIAAVTIIVLMPKESPQSSDASAPNTVASSSSSTKRNSLGSTTSNGNRLQTFQFPEAKSTQSDGRTPYSDPDEDGSFWKFDGGR